MKGTYTLILIVFSWRIMGEQIWDEEANCFKDTVTTLCTSCQTQCGKNPIYYLKHIMVDVEGTALPHNVGCLAYTENSEYILDHINHIIYSQGMSYIS